MVDQCRSEAFAAPFWEGAHLNDVTTVIDDAGGDERDGSGPVIQYPQSLLGNEFCEHRVRRQFGVRNGRHADLSELLSGPPLDVADPLDVFEYRQPDHADIVAAKRERDRLIARRGCGAARAALGAVYAFTLAVCLICVHG